MGFSSLAAAGISGISSLLGASQVSDGASKAAQAQAIAGQNATNALNGALGTTTNQLAPYLTTGSGAVQTLGNQLGALSTASDTPTARYVNPSSYGTDPDAYATSGTANNISGTANNVSGTANNISGTANNISADPYETSTSISQSDLENTPGYQFTLNQGEKAVQNAAAARGLGVSGAALKGAATYATGLSDQTYNTRFNQEQSANAQNFSQANTAANTNFGQQATAAQTNFGQQNTAATTNFSQQATAAQTNYAQQSGANAQNFSNDLNANKQNISNALTGAAQNFGMDQTGYTDSQANKSQSYNMLTGASSLGDQATAQQVQANTATAVGTANALTGVGNAQAAADNASGQAYGAAATGVGNALTGAVGNYNAYGIASAINPNIAGANTFGNALTNALGSNNNFLNTVSGAVKNNTTGTAGGSMNV